MHELAMQLPDDAGVVQDDLGDERPGLEIPTPFALEEVPLGAHHRAALQHRRQIRHGSSSLLVVLAQGATPWNPRRLKAPFLRHGALAIPRAGTQATVPIPTLLRNA